MARWLALMLLAGGEAAAQMPDLLTQTLNVLSQPGALTLGRWDASLGVNYGLGHDRTQSAASESAFAQRNSSETLSIANHGITLLDPGLVSGSLGLTLGLGQNRVSSIGPPATGGTTLLGYFFEADILNDKPYGGALFATRSQAIAIQPFGRVETASTMRGVSLRLNEGSPLTDMGYPYLSAGLHLDQQQLEELTTSALNPGSQHSELRTSLRHEGHRGYQSADLDWRYEFNDVQEPSAANRDYRSQNGNLNYSVDFGPTLNRRWDSRLSYLDRAGRNPLSLISLSEGLHLAHYGNLSTDYGYQLSEVATQGGTSLSQSASASANYRPYQNLGSHVSAQHQQQPAGQTDTLGGGVNYNYRHALPWGGKLSLAASGGYTLTQTHIQGGQAMIKAEPHVVTAELPNPGFLLGQGYVVGQPEVWVTHNGFLWQAQPGSDYTLVQEGNLTRILPQTGAFSPGDTFEVNYVYAIPPSLTYGNAAKSASASVDYGWVSLSASHSGSALKLLSGQDSRFLSSSSSDSARLDLRGSWRTLQGRAGAAYTRSISTLVSSTEQRYYQTASYQYARSLAFSLDADWTVSNYQAPARQNDAFGARLSADWYTPGGWVVNAAAGRHTLKDSLGPGETVTQESLKAQTKYGKLSLTTSLSANQRLRGSSQMTNWRVDFSLVRSL